jgi:hypothetical protein
MTVSVGAATVVLAGTIATISEVNSNGPASILYLAGLVGALALLWRTLFRKGIRRHSPPPPSAEGETRSCLSLSPKM